MTPAERAAAREEHTFSTAAPGLAGDWEALVAEIVERFTARDKRAAAADA
jgi:hypothetical protein